MKKLGEVCESELGKTLNKSKDIGELYPYLCSINVLWDTFDFNIVKEARFTDTEVEKYSVQKGDLLICEGGDIGRAAIWAYDKPFLYQNALHRVRFNGSVDARFCLYYLRCLKKKGVIDSTYGKGVTIKHLVKSSLLSIPIPVPPLSEQHRIVSELDSLSGIIEKKREQLKELDNLAQAVFYEMFGDPVRNEKGWEVVKIGEVCEIISGSTPKTNVEKYWNGPHFWVTPAEIDKKWIAYTKRTITDEGVNSAHLQLLPVGTVLLSSRAPIGKVAITKVPMYCNQGFKNLVCSERLHNEYLYTYLKLNTDFLISLGVGATFKEISRTIVSSIRIPVPPFSLQQQFADRISAIDRQKTLIQQSLSEVENLFHSRMDNYFG